MMAAAILILCFVGLYAILPAIVYLRFSRAQLRRLEDIQRRTKEMKVFCRRMDAAG